jgi:hypothetical protein
MHGLKKPGVALLFIRLGKPAENSYIESFNGRFRGEGVNEHRFVSMRRARRVIDEWRNEYYTERPRGSLGYLMLRQFAQAHEAKQISISDSNSVWTNTGGRATLSQEAIDVDTEPIDAEYNCRLACKPVKLLR